MLIRQFVPEDIVRVQQIEDMSFDQSYGLQMFKKLYELGTGFLVAEEEGLVVGYIIFWVKYEREGHIISIAVDKDYRNSKIGSKLLYQAIVILSACDIDKITLEVEEHNKAAIELYKSFDFKIDRVVPGYYGNNQGAILMYLDV